MVKRHSTDFTRQSQFTIMGVLNSLYKQLYNDFCGSGGALTNLRKIPQEISPTYFDVDQGSTCLLDTYLLGTNSQQKVLQTGGVEFGRLGLLSGREDLYRYFIDERQFEHSLYCCN